MTPTIASDTRCQYLILQKGSLPLRPDREIDRVQEHRCTSVLIWPEGATPSSENTILSDPCFTETGLQYAQKQLQRYRVSLDAFSRVFITHRHWDHRPAFSGDKPQRRLILFQGKQRMFAGIQILACPGHSPDSKALLFRAVSGHIICLAGDAILNKTWLKAWKYYWPNSYEASEVIHTWQSVAGIISLADRIIPGHGHQISVTIPLVRQLMRTFSSAEYAEDCPNVLHLLEQRLKQLNSREVHAPDPL